MHACMILLGHHEVSPRIEEYVKVDDLSAVYQRMLLRWRELGAWVHDALRLLFVSHQGLRDEDIIGALQMLGHSRSWQELTFEWAYFKVAAILMICVYVYIYIQYCVYISHHMALLYLSYMLCSFRAVFMQSLALPHVTLPPLLLKVVAKDGVFMRPGGQIAIGSAELRRAVQRVLFEQHPRREYCYVEANGCLFNYFASQVGVCAPVGMCIYILFVYMVIYIYMHVYIYLHIYTM